MWKLSFQNKIASWLFSKWLKQERRDFYSALLEVTNRKFYQYTNKHKFSCYHKPTDRPQLSSSPGPKSCTSWRYKESLQLFQVSSAEGCLCPYSACLERQKSHSHYFHNYLNNAFFFKKKKKASDFYHHRLIASKSFQHAPMTTCSGF